MHYYSQGFDLPQAIKSLVMLHAALHSSRGGQLVWLAPAGGRDRPNADDEWLPAPFDASAVELMRTLLGKAKRPGHLYPFAMSSWAIMPPA